MVVDTFTGRRAWPIPDATTDWLINLATEDPG